MGSHKLDRETKSDAFAPHQAPTRQFVITLSATLKFETATGAASVAKPGDILLAEDDTGSGRRRRLTDDEPWRRAYVFIGGDVEVPFIEQGA